MRSLASATLLLLLLLMVPAAPAHAGADWAWPVRGQVLTEFRNGDDPYAAGQHRGVDIAAPVGTPVVAASAGTIVFAGVVGSSGLVVSERSGDGRYELSYLHLSAVSVHRGDVVGRGDRVASSGVSGTRSVEQPHLHFGVREAGDRHAYLDPLTFLAPAPAERPQPEPAPAPVREPAPAAPAAAPALAAPPASAAVHGVPGHAVAHRTPHGEVPSSAPAPAAHSPRPVAHVVTRAPHAALAEPRPHHTGVPRSIATPEHGPGATRVATAAPVHAPRPQAAGRHRGIDVGWLAACGGLVLAAGLLAGPGGGRGKRQSARATFGALIRATSRT